jgi:phage replication initiation protein
MGQVMGCAVIDWLSFTFVESDISDIPALVQLWLEEWMKCQIGIEEGNGLYGFSKSVKFYRHNMGVLVPVGVLAWGGDNQKDRVYLSLSGTGCMLIKDWGNVKRILEFCKARLTRVDVAVDAMNGEFSPHDAVSWYSSGGFTRGGRRPKYKVEGDWLEDIGQGKTFYVGRRENGKYARLYEKGKQLGDVNSNWSRFEVEIHNVDRVIPYDILTNPSMYFAGSYPCCEGLVDVGAERILTIQKEREISMARLMSYCRQAYGRLIYVLKSENSDDSFIIKELSVEGSPRRLEKSALYLANASSSGGALKRSSKNEVHSTACH